MAESVSDIISLVTASLKTWKVIDKAINSLKNAPANVNHWKVTETLLRAVCSQVEAVVKRKQHSILTKDEAGFCEAIRAHLDHFHKDLLELSHSIPTINSPGQAGRGALARFRDRSMIAIWNEISLDKELCARVDRNIQLISVSATGLSLLEPGPEDKIRRFVDLLEALPSENPQEDTADGNLVEGLRSASIQIAKRATVRDILDSRSQVPDEVDQPRNAEVLCNVGLEELRYRFETALEIATHVFDAGLFIVAAEFQLDAIKFATQLKEAGAVLLGTANRVSLEDRYVTILKSCQKFDLKSHEATLRLDQLASPVRDVFDQPCAIDMCREARNIGALYAKLQEPEKAIEFLRFALLKGYLKMDTSEYRDQINEVLRLLTEQYDHQGHISKSRAIQRMVRDKLAEISSLSPTVLSKTLEWCGRKGFSVKVENGEVCFDPLATAEGNTPLHEAAHDMGIDPDILPQLMKYEFCLSVDRNKDTPLLVAAERANIKVLEALLSVSCLVHVRDKRKQTPLHRCEDPEALELLIKAINRQNSVAIGQEMELITINTMAGRETALHLACRRGRVELVEKLISGGADVNAHCNLKQTPLMVACMARIPMEKRDHIIRQLINGGAAHDSVDVENKHARAYLKHQGYKDSDVTKLFIKDSPRLSLDSGFASMTTVFTDGWTMVQAESSSSEQGSIAESRRSRFSFRFGRTFSKE